MVAPVPVDGKTLAPERTNGGDIYAAPCKKDWSYCNGDCYRLFIATYKNTTWLDARKMCWSYGADLANSDKKRCIKETLKETQRGDIESKTIIYAGTRLSSTTCEILEVPPGIYSTRKCNDVITDRFTCVSLSERSIDPKSHPESNICTRQTKISPQLKQIYCSPKGVGTARLGMQNDTSNLSLNAITFQ
ncbi:unnamed protein product [Owenia fusiformis]|uniref:Uncharacterized protein n=1 Tax=Owenia fusiformis TaxID=6347 RepID=A0A8J1TFR8_OWEFU|nr:unnamed protein product [Owenia fusiformis]